MGSYPDAGRRGISRRICRRIFRTACRGIIRSACRCGGYGRNLLPAAALSAIAVVVLLLVLIAILPVIIVRGIIFILFRSVCRRRGHRLIIGAGRCGRRCRRLLRGCRSGCRGRRSSGLLRRCRFRRCGRRCGRRCRGSRRRYFWYSRNRRTCCGLRLRCWHACRLRCRFDRCGRRCRCRRIIIRNCRGFSCRFLDRSCRRHCCGL